MDEIASIERRVARLKRLAKEYYALPDKALIERHDELLRVFDIRGSIHSTHPHKMQRVYISRRSLKHFVEERKRDLLKHHSKEVTIDIICFVLDKLQETITDFDKYEFEPPKSFYIKDYSSLEMPAVRVLLDEKTKEKHLEIWSIHLHKYRKESSS